ncbi:hypothetical protein [Streptomyces sp. NRRL F-5053]|uniref:hypothetical protein n=1 Tax=Streptomyces sp. NRRL F-5053 TaxID=1463854 RepID=UPI0004C8B0E6|nr:hypothetical protein [Streptomyces sp. NRRL F-5053]
MAQGQTPGTDLVLSGRGRRVLPVPTAASRRHTRRDGQPQDGNASRDGYTRWRSGSEEDIVDAEIIDEPGPQDSASARRRRLRDRARGFFGARTKEQMADRERQRSIEVTRAADDGEGHTEREHLLKLRAETKHAGERYMQSLRDSKLLVPGFNDDEREQEFDIMHRVYMQMMMHSCLKPLSRGVDAHAVIQAVGMMTAMRMLSPDFRKEMDSYLQPVKDKMQERIDTRTSTMVSEAQREADRHNRLVDARTAAQLKRDPSLADDQAFLARQESKKRDHTAYLSKKWQRRWEDIERRERGNREMFTPESAAMTEVALMENAFWRMRDSQHDAGEIEASYRAMRKHLRDQMAKDGLSRQEVVRHARIIIGERMEAEPELQLMFNGMAHGRITKAAPHLEQMAGTGRIRMVWRGEFNDHLGRPVPEDGMFTLRRPMGAAEHQVQLAETMKSSMLDALSRDSQEGYEASVAGYLIGFAARKEGLDTSRLPPALAQRIEQTESMQASMDIDGLPEEDQRWVYSNAFTDAMEEVATEHPGIEARLRRSFGTDWQATLYDAVSDPGAWLAAQAMRAEPFEAGPGHPAQRGRAFVSDWGYTARQADSGDHQPV